jgi:transcriptional/translational regulatory protein YebC/TACO1
VRAALKAAGIAYESAEISWLASVSVQLDDDAARKVLRLVDALEDCDDVQNVWANFDISDEVMAEA